VCLVIGALGGIGTALVTKPAPAQPLSFTPPRVPAPDFRLRDQNGFWTAPKDARGQVLIITFLYSRCRDLCPRQAGEIKDAVLSAGKGVRVYGITVDPEHDTPAMARAWIKKMGLEGGPVSFLVGSRQELAPVWRAFGVTPIAEEEEEEEEYGPGYEEHEEHARQPLSERPPPEAALDPYPDANKLAYRGRPRHGGGADYEHSAYVLLVDKKGRQRVGFPFEQLSPDRLLRDIRKLKAEPS
jgi:protein SCO1/2